MRATGISKPNKGAGEAPLAMSIGMRRAAQKLSRCSYRLLRASSLPKRLLVAACLVALTLQGVAACAATLGGQRAIDCCVRQCHAAPQPLELRCCNSPPVASNPIGLVPAGSLPCDLRAGGRTGLLSQPSHGDFIARTKPLGAGRASLNLLCSLQL